MTTEHERVQAYYSAFDEWGRLDSPAGALEFSRAMRVLEQHLVAGSRVLDLGGGPGRYTIELARRGHRVVLADLTPALLEHARARISASNLQDRVESVDEVNAQDLGTYADRSFDAVLVFGPFYHLLSEGERSRAAREMARVLRPDGIAFVAIMPRISGIAGLIERAAARPDQVSAETLRIAASTGVFRNAAAAGFQEGYYPRPGEIEALLGVAGLAVQKTISLRSVAYRLEEGLSQLTPSVQAQVEAVMDSMSSLPEVIASSGHALVIARRVP